MRTVTFKLAAAISVLSAPALAKTPDLPITTAVTQPQPAAANAVTLSNVESAKVGIGLGLGFNPYPTSRFELDLLFNEPQIFTVSFEASTFSNNHPIAKTLLIDNYERDVKRRRLSLMYRNMFSNSLYYTVGLGFENYVANMLGPVAEYSRDFKTIITGVRQGYTFTAGLGQSFKNGPLNFRIEWLGFSWLKKSKAITFVNADKESSLEKLIEAQDKIKSDTGESIRLMNTTLSYEF
ncbi:hypothetical protein EBU99_12930 [bacterium]|nr:hypothetical protein [bacterium]